ncbi:MAG TPA: sigma-70 family RNA polymerase sigma factor, partial [Chloroflexota bacterium]|nr:sigma-70 family RNA polymerase sigma factor [Chloroflexota bacterium]
MAFRITGSPEDAEDAVQEAFVAAVTSWESFRSDANVGTWLHRIAVNAALTCVRKRPATSWLEDEGILESGIRDWTIDLESDVERHELREQINAGLEQLDPDTRAVVILRDVEQF